ncbi:hypothetical protein OG895_41485 [Streptomyces sp. NBC_00201]|uniref:hypothetical protein n=1 Tax=unclassified Streptomyces TaxID=2593676 RepID=UPI002250EB10|nr:MULTISPECIES: hypothetical protein [unclassified Streptomyces]MCX5064145.1 hypothetical protein [Streptomyces sp. NBC_00452]MCX5251565.1 hypothetical protein [Streptomyces sp. NBC_00201]MCX5294511.1 hypothetical protein [Streptomyces sp. NBC_00183]
MLIFDRQNLVEPFTVFPFGMTEFLRKLVVDELDSYDMKFEPMPRFVHWPVAERGGSADSTERGLRTWAGGRQWQGINDAASMTGHQWQRPTDCAHECRIRP